MIDRTHKILLVEPDPVCVELLVASLTRRLDAHITCVSDAESGLDTELVEPHDLVISELRLGESTGLQLAGKLMSLGARPVILLADQISRDEAIEALRLGVCDVFHKPFPVELLLDAAAAALRARDVQRRQARKYRGMRELVRRAIRERRNLDRRVELVCRDLVNAHRQLVDRVLSLEQARSRT